MQDIKDALPGTFAEHGRGDIALLVQSAGTFQKIQVVNGVFLYRFTSYAGLFIGYGEKPVKVSGRLFIQVFMYRTAHSSCHTRGRKSLFALPTVWRYLSQSL